MVTPGTTFPLNNIDPMLAHRAGVGEELIWKLVGQGWKFQEIVWTDRHKNDEIHVVSFQSPRMKAPSIMLMREWVNITQEYLTQRELENI